MNIVTIRTTRLSGASDEVIPIDRPVLASAETISKRIARKPEDSITVRISKSTTIIRRNQKRITKALRIQ